MTMPTALNRDVLGADLTPLFSPKRESMGTMHWVAELSDPQYSGFYFYGTNEYSVAGQQAAYEHILERNDIVRRVAKALRLPLVDLFAVLDTAGANDIRKDFFDILHPRPRAYPKIARAMLSRIKDAGLLPTDLSKP